MRIAQFSDLHFGGTTLDEAGRCFGFAIEQAVARASQCAVISGDATDHAVDAHSPAFEALVRNVRRLAEQMPVLLLQGTWSHEPPGTLNIFRHLGGCKPIHVADRIEQVALLEDGTWLQSESWRFDDVPAGAAALFTCLPTLNKAAVAGVYGGRAASLQHGELIADVLRGFAPVNAAAAAAGVATIGVSHGTVYGCESEHGVPMAGLDHEFTTGVLFGAGTAAFMLGHIHKHQSWRDGRRTIAYPGSIGRFHFGELGEKGFLLWDVQAPATAEIEFVPTPAKRTIELEFNGAPDQEQLAAIAATAQGAHVRVRWTVDEGDRAQVDRQAILDALNGAAAVKLEGSVKLVTRARAPGIGMAKTTEDKLAHWAKATGQDPVPLAERLAQLSAFDPQAVVASILAALPGSADASAATTASSERAVAGGGSEPKELSLFE